MRGSFLMRVLFCKIHCPFICFCKPSAAHLYNPGALKLENKPNASPLTVSGSPDTSADHFSGETAAEIKQEEESVDGRQQEAHDIALKSCIRKGPIVNGTDPQKKRVQWMDNIGKELAEIKEYESSETGDTDNEEESRGCVCTIL